MTELNAFWFFSELVGCYVVGWSVGYLILFVKQMVEKI